MPPVRGSDGRERAIGTAAGDSYAPGLQCGPGTRSPSPAFRRLLPGPARVERQGFMARVRIETSTTCDGGGNPISAGAREVANRVQQLPDEVIASFTVPDARARALRLRQIGTELLIDAVPLLNRLERHRSPQDAALAFSRLRHVTDEAVACAQSEIPEYVGGRITPPVGEPSKGTERTATLLVVTRLLAASLSEWADQIDAEAGRTSPHVRTTVIGSTCRRKTASWWSAA